MRMRCEKCDCGEEALDIVESEVIQLKVRVVHIKGKHTDFTQPVESRQVEHAGVHHAGMGKSVGLKVLEKVREHDHVYLV